MRRAWHRFFNMRDRSRDAAQGVADWLRGFASRRSLPKWRKDTYRDRSDWRYATAQENAAAREIVLFADTFNRYFERENLDDALSVLVAGGYRVYAPQPADPDDRPLCCGRTFLSVGLVDEARREMQRTLDALAPYVARGAAGDRSGAELPAHFPRRIAGFVQGRDGRTRWRRTHFCSRNFSPANSGNGS